jgi:hypothetical protein
MKRALLFCGVALLFFFLGAGAVWVLMRQPQRAVPQGWIDIIPAKAPLLFDTAALSEDIPFPKFTDHPLSGRVKFLMRDKGTVIGYELRLYVSPNPVASLPAKYRQSIKLDNGLTFGPPEQVGYSGEFTFDLQDADGFTLSQIKSQSEHVVSGTTNELKGMTADTVPDQIAKSAKKIVVGFDAEKCDLLEK